MSLLLCLLNSLKNTTASSLTQRLEVCWERTYTTTPSALLLTDQDSLIGMEEGKRVTEGEEAFSSLRGYLQLHPPPEDPSACVSNRTLPIPLQSCRYEIGAFQSLTNVLSIRCVRRETWLTATDLTQ